MSVVLHRRATDVVWRLGPDRVLVRRVGVGGGQTHELHGAAVLVWISLDEPGSMAEIVARIIDAGVPADEQEVTTAVELLLGLQLVIAQPLAG